MFSDNRSITSDVTDHRHNGTTQGSVSIGPVPIYCGTGKQRYTTAMSHLQQFASFLSELPPSRFQAAMIWIDSIYQQLLSGEWELTVKIIYFAICYTNDLVLSLLIRLVFIHFNEILCTHFYSARVLRKSEALT